MARLISKGHDCSMFHHRSVSARHALSLLAALSSLALSACSGEVDDGEAPGVPSGAEVPGGVPSDYSMVPGAVVPGEGAVTPGVPPGASVGPDGITPLTPDLPAGSGGAGGVVPGPVATTPAVVNPDAPTPAAPSNPGTVTVRRLNHVEYNNTVHALLGTELRPADSFLTDDPGDGFDTVGAALSLAPAYVRDYEAAAQELIGDLFADEERLSQIVTCDVQAEGASCAEAVLTAFARKAYRRPVTTEEVATLMTPFDTAQTLGASAADGLRYSMVAALVSPYFIFKLEIDPDPASATPRRLNDHELATRLSYSLWSTMPDDELLAAADAGQLSTDAGLTEQVDRMLLDPRIEALAENFASQWLEFRDLEDHQIDSQTFPEFNSRLIGSMQAEAKAYFMEFMQGQHTLQDFIDARFTFVDSVLAEHYDLPDPGTQPGQMALVDTSAVPRSGVMTLGAVLTSTSYSTRTSPVLRGQFVMSQLLCSEVPPPPPDIMGLPDQGGTGNTDGLTLRQRLELHRQDAACYACHQLMDPIGFGLENYDAIGRYRTQESGLDIDSSGNLAGTDFSGATDLSTILAADKRFGACVAKKLMTFALGRFINQADDSVWTAHLSGTVRDSGGNFGALVRGLLMSEAFRSRQTTAL